MDTQDLRILLAKTDNKLSIFISTEILSKYNFNIKELLNLIDEFLNDEEKIKLLDYSLYRQLGIDIMTQIIELISDENLLVQLLDNENIMMILANQIFNILIEKLSDISKKQLLYNPTFIEKHYILNEFILSLSEQSRIEILYDIELIKNKLQLENRQISTFIESLTDENTKRKMLQIYQLEDYLMFDITRNFNNPLKLQTILEEKKMNKYYKIKLLISLDIETLKTFFLDSKNFCTENDIHPYEITAILDSNKQIDFVKNIENMNLTINEKREILAALSTEAKQNIDKRNFTKEYENAISVGPYSDNIISQILHNNMICNLLLESQIVDFLKNLTNCKKQEIFSNEELMDRLSLDDGEIRDIISSLDIEGQRKILINNGISIDKFELLEGYHNFNGNIKVNPEQFNEDERKKFIQLCTVYPELQVVNTLDIEEECEYGVISTSGEYIEAEEWISSILNSINPKYSKAQKIAIIDNAIGKKISYSPDFNTEIFDEEDCRALWKIIASGYGICNGIARLEQYMLSRVGIESEVVNSNNHTFLKIKNIELTLANGQIVKGNTILDPTWNLAAHRFGGKPNNFLISYEEARKHDNIEGDDYYCHENDRELNDATLNLDEQSLRHLFTSVGLANEKGIFPITYLMEKSKLLHESYINQPALNIERQFLLLSKFYPEFATCQNSTMVILKDVLLSNENLKFDKCVENRVYDRTDREKRPILFVYIESKELGKKFYYANKNEGKFIELPQEEFTEQFECYEEDLQRNNGFRPWEIEKQENIDLSNSSGTIFAKEGEEK